MKAFLALVTVLGSLTATQAQIFFFANLDTSQEVPPHSGTATGIGQFTLSGSTLTVDTGTYQNLPGAPLYVQLYLGAPGVNGLFVSLFHIDTSTMLTGTFSGSVSLTPTDITALEAGNFYVNIVDATFPAGDIRGQLEPTPEPSTLALFGAGTLALISVRIRRRSFRSANTPL